MRKKFRKGKVATSSLCLLTCINAGIFFLLDSFPHSFFSFYS
jgi:hypothetical protein